MPIVVPDFSLDWRLTRAFRLSNRFELLPTVEMFNTFNNANNINPLSTPALFNFDGVLRTGLVTLDRRRCR
ncbi:MAG TPA: hypothetical protein VIK60_13925 [Vicinamibacterales bacterium]